MKVTDRLSLRCAQNVCCNLQADLKRLLMWDSRLVIGCAAAQSLQGRLLALASAAQHVTGVCPSSTALSSSHYKLGCCCSLHIQQVVMHIII